MTCDSKIQICIFPKVKTLYGPMGLGIFTFENLCRGESPLLYHLEDQGQLEIVDGRLSQSQGQNRALTVLNVPFSLDIRLARRERAFF